MLHIRGRAVQLWLSAAQKTSMRSLATCSGRLRPSIITIRDQTIVGGVIPVAFWRWGSSLGEAPISFPETDISSENGRSSQEESSNSGEISTNTTSSVTNTNPVGTNDNNDDSTSFTYSSTDASSSSSETSRISRGKKLPPPPQEYIILGARSSRVIPRLRPSKEAQSIKNIKVDDLDEQRKQLLVFTRDAPLDSALANIDRMRPQISTLSLKRYDQLMIDLKRSFAVPQLRAYIRSKSETLKSSGNKSQLIDIILKTLWRVTASDSVSESSDVIIERTIQLSRRELFIIVSQNGKLPRSWTKSGASIVILGDEQKIIVRATADTCNWVMASLHKTLQSIQSVDIDFACLEEFASINDIPLDKIQRLSDTYLSYQKSDKILVASARSRDQTNHAERLIVHSTGFMPGTTSSYIYSDIPSSSSSSEKSMSRVIDDDAVSWNERSRCWHRWKKVRHKRGFRGFDEVEMNPSSPYQIIISEGKINREVKEPIKVESSLQDIVSSKLLQVTDPSVRDAKSERESQPESNQQLTFTATFGYLLHDIAEKKIDVYTNPSKVVERAFCSNTPFIFQRCSELPLYNLETDHDPSLASSTSSPSSETTSLSPDTVASSPSSDADDAWNKLLSNARLLSDSNTSSFGGNSSDPSKGIREDQRLLLEDDSMRLIQLKFIPSPFHVKDSKVLKNLPPVEMWFEIKKSDECDLDSIRLVSAEREVNAYLSLPDFEADIKFSATTAKFLDHTEQPELKSFMSRAQLDISGNKKIHVPNYLRLSLPGIEEQVTYLYQSMCYRRQIDLSYKGHILQLSSLEAGGFGGRRLESNLVLDFPDGGLDKVNQTSLNSFIRDALAFCQSLRRQSIHL